MATNKFYFLPVNHSLRRQDRAWFDVEAGAAKGHSARIAHQRRFSRVQQEEERKRAFLKLVVPQAPRTGPLNPFIVLSVDLTVEQRQLIHEYLTFVPAEYYGTSAASNFCPVRDVTLGLFSSSSILLYWALLFSRHRRVLQRGEEPERDTSLLEQRQLTYRAMSFRLHDESTATTEDAMFDMAFSALLEHRSGDQVTAQRHLQACLAVRDVRIKRGDSVLSYPRGSLCIPICVVVGVPNIFDSPSQVTVVRERLEELFRKLGIGYQRQFDRPRQTHQPEVAHGRPVLQQVLLEFVAYKSTTNRRVVLAILLAMSIVTSALAEHSSNEFLLLIAHCVESAEPAAEICSKGMTPLGLLLATFMCIDEICTQLHPLELDLWSVLEAVELLMYAQQDTIRAVQQQLMARLFCEDVGQPLAQWSHSETDIQQPLFEGIEAAWMARTVLEREAL